MTKKQIPVTGHARKNTKNVKNPVTFVEAHVRNVEIKTPANCSKTDSGSLRAIASDEPVEVNEEVKLDREKLKAARFNIGRKFSYYRRLLYRMPIIETRSLDTFAVDKFGRIYINPDYGNSLAVEYFETALIHEFNHFIRNHAKRFEGKSSYKGNLAGDCEINDDLADNPLLAAHESWIYPDKTFGLPTGRLAEEYYDTIPTKVEECPDCGRKKTKFVTVEGQKKAAEKAANQAAEDAANNTSGAASGVNQAITGTFETTVIGRRKGYCPTCSPPPGEDNGDNGDGDSEGESDGDGGEGGNGGNGEGGMPDYLDDEEEGGCGGGSGSGGKPIEGELGDPEDGGEGISSEEADRIRGEIARDIMSGGKDRSDVPGGLYEWADKFLKPKVNWQKHFKRELSRALFRASGSARSTWDKPSRRIQTGRPGRILKPGYYSPKINVAIVVDTSGSMSGEDIAQALGEVNGILKAQAVAGENVTVLTVSTRVAECKKVSDASQIKVMERGGTDMRIGIEHAETLPRRPNVIIVLTDGLTPWSEKQPKDIHVIAGIIGSDDSSEDTRRRFGIPNFIASVPIPREDS